MAQLITGLATFNTHLVDHRQELASWLKKDGLVVLGIRRKKK
jgi:preprotein translocase subunit SecY